MLRRDQALACGLTVGQIDQRVRDGRWCRLGSHGYRLIEMDDSSSLVRAAIATLPDAVVSHQAAAELHGLPKVPRGIASVTVDARTTHRFPGVVVHRNQDIEESHVIDLAGIPTTTVPRTVVDLAAVLRPRHLADVVDEAVASGQTSFEELDALLARVARRGKPGVRAMRSALEIRGPGPERGTTLERLGARVLINGGLPEPVYEFPIPWAPGRRFDAAYPERRLAIEWDSVRWHTQLEAFHRDRERDRLAILHGWRVLRFTWDDVIQRPEMVVRTVRQALEQSIANPGL